MVTPCSSQNPLTVLVYELESSSFALNVFELERMTLNPGKHAGECRAMIADRDDNQTFCKTQIQMWTERSVKWQQLARAVSLCSHNPGRGLSNKVTNIDRSGKFGCSCHRFFFNRKKEVESIIKHIRLAKQRFQTQNGENKRCSFLWVKTPW